MLIIDGSHHLHRCIHALRDNDLKDLQGRPTGGIHAFLMSLSALCSEKNCSEAVFVAWDAGVPLHRRKLYNEYKPKKSIILESGEVVDNTLLSSLNKIPVEEWGEEIDEDFLSQYTFTRTVLHKEILPYLGCVSLQIKNCEADDIISVWCDKFKTQEFITVLSSDRDLNQLIDQNVSQYDGIKKIFIDEDEMRSQYGGDNWRELWLWNKALVGDSSDGIPGFPKIGGVAARNYAEQICKGTSPSELKRAPRGSQEALDNLKLSFQDVLRNKNLMDLSYIKNQNDPLYNIIINSSMACNSFEINEDRVCNRLKDLGLRKVLDRIDYIMDSNSNCPPSDILKYLL